MFLIEHVFNDWTFVLYLIVYLLVLGGAALYLVTINHYRSKIRLYNLRNDWTNQLHNDIGGDLSSIALRLQLVRSNLQDNPEDCQRKLDDTLLVLKEVQAKLRFVFDLIDTKKNSLKVVLDDLESFARENCPLANMKLECNNVIKYERITQIDLGRVNKLYLVLKEAINNSIKHSRGTILWLDIKHAAKGIEIIIKDDGVGFELMGEHDGNGLNNMAHMAQEAIVDYEVRSDKINGTEIRCFVPFV